MLIAMWLLGQTLQEARQLHRRERLQRIPLASHLRPLPLAVNDRIPGPAARRLLRHSRQPILPVEEGGQWRGGLVRAGDGVRRLDLPILDAAASLGAAWLCLAQGESPGVLVLQAGRPAGWISREQIEALGQEPPAGWP
ncbi:MAG: hypothetical protein J7452_06370, partial [Thermoflexus sp.]|nr:hypothetical protein [Thermoflexus sp.]